MNRPLILPYPLVLPGPSTKQVGQSVARLIATIRRIPEQHETAHNHRK